MSYQYLNQTEESKNDQETGIFRNYMCADRNNGELIEFPINKATTVYEIIKKAIESKKSKDAIGYREVIGEIEETKQIEKKVDGKVVTVDKTWKFYKLSDYRWLNYNQIDKMLIDLSNGLYELGLRSKNKITFYAPTSHYWILLAYASFYKNLTVATVYDTLGAEGLQHGLKQTESTTLFLSTEQISILETIYSDTPSLTHVIYTGNLKENQLEKFEKIKFVSFDELIELGKANVTDPIPPSPEDNAVIMYTSGSTGNPKGAQLTHGMLTSHVAGIEFLVEPWLGDNERVISFLPLAHILAFILNTFSFHYGMEVGFASPRTLLDASVRECSGDLVALKPTILPGVPQVFDAIRKGILNKVHSAGDIQATIFNVSLSVKSFLGSYQLPTGWLDQLVFSKLKEATGGRLRVGICGGAPLSEDVRNFFSNALCTVTQAYGMTELCGMGSVMPPDNLKPCCIGIISPCMEFKLVDFAEGSYFSKDKVGELWVRGPSVTKGYFKDAKSTKESITEDGWLQTGDIARLDDEGQLYIVDRKKNLVKVSNGEYIALEKLESIYRNSLFVHNICLCADSHYSKPVAIIQANLPALNRFALANDLQPIEYFEDLVGRDDLTAEVLKSCLEEAKKANFNNSEKISGVYLTEMEWSVDNDMLTAAQKIKRKTLSDKFSEQLKVMFNDQ